jgi:hypothetical protein
MFLIFQFKSYFVMSELKMIKRQNGDVAHKHMSARKCLNFGLKVVDTYTNFPSHQIELYFF